MSCSILERCVVLALVLAQSASQSDGAVPTVRSSPSVALLTPGDEALGGPRLTRLLLSAEREGQSAEEIGAAVAAFGSASIPALLDVLIAGIYHEKISGSVVVAHVLEGDARVGVSRALASFRWESVRRHISQRLGGDLSAGRRGAILRVLGEVLPTGELDVLLEPLVGVSRPHRRAVSASLAGALGTALARETATYLELPAFYATVPLPYLRAVVEGAKDGGDLQALAGLADLLGKIPAADPLVAIELADLAKTVQRPVPERTLRRIREVLRSSEVAVQVEGAKALGRLDDVASVPDLIACLGSPNASLQTASRYALERLSAERFGVDVGAWSQWHADAQAWLRGEAPKWQAHLRTGDPSKVTRALLQVSRYRIFRYEFVGEIVSALGTDDEKTAVVTCAVLGHFGTEGCVRALVTALDRPSVKVRKAALEALQRATGLSYGEHAHDWRAAGWGPVSAPSGSSDR